MKDLGYTQPDEHDKERRAFYAENYWRAIATMMEDAGIADWFELLDRARHSSPNKAEKMESMMDLTMQKKHAYINGVGSWPGYKEAIENWGVYSCEYAENVL